MVEKIHGASFDATCLCENFGCAAVSWHQHIGQMVGSNVLVRGLCQTPHVLFAVLPRFILYFLTAEHSAPRGLKRQRMLVRKPQGLR